MRTLFIIVFICLTGIFLCVPVLHAQQIDTTVYHQLKGVEVVEKARPSTTREATPLQVMDRSGIERLGIQDLSEAVKRFSGATVKDYGGIGGLKTVSVRSLGAQHMAVSYDGVTITDAQSGQVDISRFSLDNVEMISLSIGQSDDIFQTARMYASAGALSVKTRKPVFDGKPMNLQAKAKGGSFGLFNPMLRYEQKISNRFSASLHADWLSAKGEYPFTLVNGDVVTEEKRKNSDIQALRLEGNLYGDLGKAGALTGKVYYYDSERGLPGSVILYSNSNRERLWNNNFFTQLQYSNKLTDNLSLQAHAKYNYSFSKYRDVSNKYSGGKQEDLNTQEEYYGSVGVLYSPWKNYSTSLTTDLAHNMLDNNFMNAPQPKRLTSLSVLSAQYKNSMFTATASLLGTYMTDKVKAGDKPADRKRLSPAVSVSLRPFPDNAIRVRASYKDIFRVPTFTDLYYLRMGNTNLQPEKATQYNLGLTWSGEAGNLFRYLSFSADGYYNKVKDKIVAIPTMYIWKMMNMGEVDIKGLDVNFSSETPLPAKMTLLLSATYSFQKAIDITDPDAKNYKDQIPYTPKHSGNASLTLENPWVNVSYSLTAAGDRYALPQNIESNLIAGYVEQGISLNREFVVKKCKLRLQGEVINLGDKTYDIIQYYPMPGRSWRLSVSIVY
ncbi:TonB-dependent receptor [Parabacteroides goldsteinii]|uniref:TonB-dependent receptor plug domain-containing protein n=1 Tax=Parabacteroides goldsteinii TaxID=328812 RepID=UPI0032C0E552